METDVPGVTVAPSQVAVHAGGNVTYAVSLNTQPSANVVITLTPFASTPLSTSPTSLTFTPSNWYLAQSVSVSPGATLSCKGTTSGA